MRNRRRSARAVVVAARVDVAEQIAGVQHADHLVERPGVHRQPAVTRLLDQLQHRRQIAVGGEADDLRPRRHRLAGRHVAEADHALDHLPLGVVDHALGAALVNDVEDLLLQLLPGLVRVVARPVAGHPPHRRVEQPVQLDHRQQHQPLGQQQSAEKSDERLGRVFGHGIRQHHAEQPHDQQCRDERAAVNPREAGLREQVGDEVEHGHQRREVGRGAADAGGQGQLLLVVDHGLERPRSAALLEVGQQAGPREVPQRVGERGEDERAGDGDEQDQGGDDPAHQRPPGRERFGRLVASGGRGGRGRRTDGMASSKAGGSETVGNSRFKGRRATPL